MIKKRLGQDIFLRIYVMRLGGTKEDFTDATDITASIWRMDSGEAVMKQPEVKGNQLRIQFAASEQASYGAFGVTVTYNKPDEESETGYRRYIVDCPFAFELVATTDNCCCDHVDVSSDPVELSGYIEVAADGINGKDGVTPHIGANGNWFIGDADTGIKAKGIKGDKGDPGRDGVDGTDGVDGIDGTDGRNGQDGVDGNLIWPTCRVDSSGYLVVDVPDGQGDCNLVIDEEGYLCQQLSDLV